MTWKPHTLENRKTRRAAVAKFDIPEEPGLRRRLLKQRQRQRRGTMKRKAKK